LKNWGVRFLPVSDLDYALKQYDRTPEAADFDSVAIAGDHLDISNPVNGSIQFVVIRKCLNV
jgi:hypothetical protein